MTREEFVQHYHEYKVQDSAAAQAECAEVNSKAVGFKVVVVNFAGVGFCLMLEEAAREMKLIDSVGEEP